MFLSGFLPGFCAPEPRLDAGVIEVQGKKMRLEIRRHPQARRYLLKVLSPELLALTIPRRGSVKEGMRFAQSQTHWISQTLLRQAARPTPLSEGWHDGLQFLSAGHFYSITLAPAPTGFSVTTGLWPSFLVESPERIREEIEKRLCSTASAQLPPRLHELAAQHGLTVNSVQIRSQKTRWGSCSQQGTISLNWRIIQAPTPVQDYILLHELMHLQHMDHSRRFWSAVEKVCPTYRQSEQWLKSHRFHQLWRIAPESS